MTYILHILCEFSQNRFVFRQQSSQQTFSGKIFYKYRLRRYIICEKVTNNIPKYIKRVSKFALRTQKNHYIYNFKQTLQFFLTLPFKKYLMVGPIYVFLQNPQNITLNPKMVVAFVRKVGKTTFLALRVLEMFEMNPDH